MTKIKNKHSLKVTALALLISQFLLTSALAEQQLSYNLAKQSLAEAINTYASQNKLTVVFDPALVKDKVSSGLQGVFSVQQGLQTLLNENQLTYELEDNIYYIRKVGEVKKSANGTVETVETSPAEVTSNNNKLGIISGRILAGDNNNNLSGALVRIEETGLTTKTDDLGNFQFSDLPAGEYTLFISFIGYPSQSINVSLRPGQKYTAHFPMDKLAGNNMETIVIYGSRSARAQALNLQRTAENNSDVISADDLGNFSGTTFSEALRRVAGVSFQRDGLTGDGTNVIVRGMAPDMNAVKLNGLNLPVGNGSGRSPDLSTLLADSVSKISIHKSLLPSQDSSGTGALIEVETRSPLSRPYRYAGFTLESGGTSKNFAKDTLYSGTISGIFGQQENFGLSASLQYRDRSVENISYNSGLRFGQYLPLDTDGLPTLDKISQVNPLQNFPFNGGGDTVYTNRLETNFNYVENTTLALTISGEWEVSDDTNLKLDIQHSEGKNTIYTLTDIFSAADEYVLLPIAALNYEQRYALDLDMQPGNESLYRNQEYHYDRDLKKTSDTYSFQGKTTLDKWEFNYLLGYAQGKERHPNSFTMRLRMPDSEAKAEYFLPEATDAVENRILAAFAPRQGDNIPIPLFSEQGWAFINDPSQYTIDTASGELDDVHGKNQRKTAKLSSRYSFEWDNLKYLEAGIFYESAEFSEYLTREQLGGGANVTTLNLDFAAQNLSDIGLVGPQFFAITESAFKAFSKDIYNQVDQFDDLSLTAIQQHPDFNKQFTREDNLAAYLQSKLEFDKLEIIGGLRFNQVEIDANNLISPTYIGPLLNGGFGVDNEFIQQYSTLVNQTNTSSNALPRLLFNYRVNDNTIYRGGYYKSVARPAISQLSTETQISFINIPIPGPEGTKPILQINTGNPALKPAITHNFDIGLEYYDDQVGLIKLGGFYKKTENLLQSNATFGTVVLKNVPFPDHPYFQTAPYFDPANPGNVFINGSSPVNSSDDATLWGIETHVEKQLMFLPGLWSGLGIYANYTYTHSSLTNRYNWEYPTDGRSEFDFRGPFNQQPEHSGTAALTYNKKGYDATLAYSYQSRRQQLFQPRGLVYFDESTDSLDFRIEKHFKLDEQNLRVYFEAADLLKGTDDADVRASTGGVNGSPKYYTRGVYLGGRSFKLGINTSF